MGVEDIRGKLQKLQNWKFWGLQYLAQADFK